MNIHMKEYVSGSDFGEVFRLFTDPSINQLIITKFSHNSMGEFNKWLDSHLERDFHDFKVFRTTDDEFVGFAYCYEFNAADGHCLYTVAIKPDYHKTGAGAFVSAEFLKHLFMCYNLRKVYAHVYSSNTRSIDSLAAFGFILEGTLREYRYYNGMFEDLLIYSLTRSDFYDRIASFIGIML